MADSKPTVIVRGLWGQDVPITLDTNRVTDRPENFLRAWESHLYLPSDPLGVLNDVVTQIAASVLLGDLLFFPFLAVRVAVGLTLLTAGAICTLVFLRKPTVLPVIAYRVSMTLLGLSLGAMRWPL
jgi:hypothetical protein